MSQEHYNFYINTFMFLKYYLLQDQPQDLLVNIYKNPWDGRFCASTGWRIDAPEEYCYTVSPACKYRNG